MINFDHLLTNDEKGTLQVRSPINNNLIGIVIEDTIASTRAKVNTSVQAFKEWRVVPAPRRGELVRLLGEELRKEKDALGALVTLETGKILAEGLGEVQEMIDICDFAVGLSRQLYGLTMPSERPGHKMSEIYHPIGPVGVISAFNFPVAVWAWNAALALVCGNPVIWKPSEKTPLTALACQMIFDRAVEKFGDAPEGLMQVVVGDSTIGDYIVGKKEIPVISATGSTTMGRAVGPIVARRFGRSILELGGNNAMIVTPTADIDMAVRSIVFSAVGTCGQRCTSLRRLIIHDDVFDVLFGRLVAAYKTIKVGDPFKENTLVGPLIDEQAYSRMSFVINNLKEEGALVHGGERVSVKKCGEGFYVKPAIVKVEEQSYFVKMETFAPILYCMKYSDFDEALELHNDVPQGLSSCIFTRDVLEAETFLSAVGSDCGIANVNIGPSGAEIGGAFGGEKETGGGRESGSDAWKAYMRRSTQTVNYSNELPLAQGIEFGGDPK